MKKTFILLVALIMAGNAEAKIRVGLKGGVDFASFADSPHYDFNNRTGWHIGGMMNIRFPFGLTLQPELLYNAKGTNWEYKGPTIDPHPPLSRANHSIGYIELPIDLQWGVKLPLLRPYLSLTPYVGYAVNNGTPMVDINKWDGGVGVGAGVDIWKLQVSVKYFWGFGEVSKYFVDGPVKNRNLMLSLGLFL
ncbi:MAG: PorT family protein [Prevotellaceae bacterium]|jgi:hypothetical protein|nr:PorT family protein [Prevotellaceae bacterium]